MARVFVTGGNGFLGSSIVRALLERGHEVRALCGADLDDHGLDDLDVERVPFDLLEAASVRRALEGGELLVHNAAVYSFWEQDPLRMYRVNALGTQNVALACGQTNAALVYISTNEVFDGETSEPYREWESPHPINPYGASKAAGEWFVRHLLSRFYIARTAWLYAPGGRNFPHRIIELADQREQLRVVTDEVGNPTYAEDLAAAIIQLVDTGRYGAYHLVNEGACSRYTFASKILELTGREDVPITPILLAQWERPSTPPSYAPLENSCAAALGIRLRPWEEALEDYLSSNG